VGHIRLVTSRLLEIGSEPDKKQSASFEFNKKIPFGIINNTKLLGLGFPNACAPVGTELTNHEIQKWFQRQISHASPWKWTVNSGDSGIELVGLSLNAASIAVYRPQPPWLITTLTINDEIIRATFLYVPANES
jgi:hypothetical protein